ncbi:MAG: hypothetical protein ACJ8GN_19150 [Longimicrobiaceae bacterium]
METRRRVKNPPLERHETRLRGLRVGRGVFRRHHVGRHDVRVGAKPAVESAKADFVLLQRRVSNPSVFNPAEWRSADQVHA